MGRGGTIALAAGVAVATFAAGMGAAWVYSGQPHKRPGVGPAPWETNLAVGGAEATALTRAVVARTGLWALPKSEVIYFNASKDQDGEPLKRGCVYEVAAKVDPPARWWSIALYRDRFWVDNPGDRYAYSKTTVAREQDGGWRILVSDRPQPGNWLPMGPKDGRFDLPLRLYQPDPSVEKNPAAIVLPTVRRLSCG